MASDSLISWESHKAGCDIQYTDISLFYCVLICVLIYHTKPSLRGRAQCTFKNLSETSCAELGGSSCSTHGVGFWWHKSANQINSCQLSGTRITDLQHIGTVPANLLWCDPYSCTCRLTTPLQDKVGEKRKTFEAHQEHAATAAKKFRKAAEAASLRKRKRKTEPVGKPNLYEEWDSSELRFSD